ncbi:MAG: hypothetical protein AB7I27_12220 [Bacteriovoracaceae bacterium]
MLFFRTRPIIQRIKEKPLPRKLFAQVIEASTPQILKLWEEGDKYISKSGIKCPSEIDFQKNIGRSYYQCQPHFWQCYWEGGVRQEVNLNVDLFGQKYRVYAKPSFDPIPEYSNQSRYYQFIKNSFTDLNLKYGILIELGVREIPGFSQTMLLTDTCRDVYLPERIYGYGKVSDKKDNGFIWDNFDRKIFIDRFYVTNQQVNEWRVYSNQKDKLIADRKLWPLPALLNLKEQKKYCAFLGKRVLEAKLFDAAAMTPADTKNPYPEKVIRPQAPWQRDLSKTFLGMARINQDYQLTPLDCQLAQVEGCSEKFFSTDSASWMGMNYSLGFYPESLINFVEPKKNIKLSSRFLPPSSEWHELGLLSTWDGEQGDLKVAFRCYEEVSP